MATAINFNWIISQKCTIHKVYDFTFEALDESTFNCTFMYDGNNARISYEGVTRNVRVFRSGMRVKDAISIGIKLGGYVKSGEVYKSPILCEISDAYDNEYMYTSICSPSHNFGVNFPNEDSHYYLGFELETAGRNNDCYDALYNFTSNVWRKVSDASIHGNGGGVEFVSTLLHPNDAIRPQFFEGFCDTLTGLAQSKTLDSTGLHCHISRSAFGDNDALQDENIAKLIYLENFILSSENLNKVFGRSSNDWSKPNQDRGHILSHVDALKQYAPNLLTNEGIKGAICNSLLYGNKSRNGHDYPSERYYRINITNKNTIEFRQGKGNINSSAIAIIAQHAVTVVNYVVNTPWHKLSAEGYYKSIPTTNKYSLVKEAFKPIND